MASVDAQAPAMGFGRSGLLNHESLPGLYTVGDVLFFRRRDCQMREHNCSHIAKHTHTEDTPVYISQRTLLLSVTFAVTLCLDSPPTERLY